MKKIKHLLLRTKLALVITILYIFIESCSYCPPQMDSICYLTRKEKLKELTDSLKTMVFEDPNTIIVFHGSGCAESKNNGTQDVIRVNGMQDIPVYATDAMVFLNGWHLKYLHDDHHVAGFGTAISNIKLADKTDNTGRILTWQAAGVLSDDNFDDSYQWCYFYTVVAWNRQNLDLVVDQRDGSCDSHDHRSANYYSAENVFAYTSLASFTSFLHNTDFIDRNVAILPRGFGFSFDCRNDHHLLQIGYNLDHSEKYIEQGKNYYKRFEIVSPFQNDSAGCVDSGFVSWDTYSIFKDDDVKRNYLFGELVSGFAGKDLNIIQPPYSILPKQGTHVDIAYQGGIRTQKFTINHVPYKYAIPALTGWNLEYVDNDQHVKEIGAWIDEFHYDKDPNLQTGTLHYTLKSVMIDRDKEPDFKVTHKSTILGIGTETGLANQKSPDLIPFSPSGTDPSAFCRFEGNGNLLRVTIKNQGNADAGASKTKVTYSNANSTAFTLDTPPIPAGGTVDLIFRVPSDCFSPDCSFKITVDSENQVDELNKQNNSKNGGCIG